MKAFLKTLAEYLFKKHGSNLGDYCLLFPNRRSGLFFKNYLRELSNKAFWMPEIYTINNFMEKLSEFEPVDPLELNFRIYSIYNRMVSNPETYDEFYYWGEMMLGDFDDIDKYLVDAQDIFSNISDLKEIENHFDYLSREQKELISRFWKFFDNVDELSSQKKTFIETWKLLHPVYGELKKELKAEGLAWEGMMYRDVAEKIRVGDYPDIPWSKVIVAGFNALNKAEKELFSHLMKSGKAEFYWDYDTSYVNDNLQEAGRFLRENLKKFPAEKDFNLPLQNLAGDKKITIYDLPSDVLQTKQLYSILDQRLSEELRVFSDTAVILSDESLLQPVLSSLPASVPALNITMGYPVSLTPVYSFVEGLMRLQKNISTRKSANTFYFRDVLAILNHQYLKSFFDDEARKVVNEINSLNKIYIEPDFFNKSSLFSEIFRRVETAAEMPAYLSEILKKINNKFPSVEGKEDPFFLEKEYIFQILTRLNKLKDIFSNIPADQSILSFSRLFKKILGNFRIPFEGEPLQGLQIMGVLESRLLDFKNLIFLSLNEGVMPARHAAFSFIPVNLRYAFALPTHEEHDAIYAYYFFRLLQRAENVSILYNSKSEGLNTGEPGRYIHQLKYLSAYNPEFKSVSFRIAEKKAVEINIDKTPEIIEKLKDFSENGSQYLSPSALGSYLDCSMKFYFTYVAGIREEDEVSEDIDASGLGSLYHDTLENLYTEHEGKLITKELLGQMSDPLIVKEKLDDAFRKVFHPKQNKTIEIKPEGRNIIIYEIIRKLVNQTLVQDAGFTDFRFIKAEEKIKINFKDPETGNIFRVGGKIDRIDERNGLLHLVDYKTGKASVKFKGLEALFDRDSWGVNDYYKSVFQVFMYCWLYSVMSGRKDLVPAIYRTSELFSQEFKPYLEDSNGSGEVRDYSKYHDEFERSLLKLLNEIFNPEVPFKQTVDETRCTFCQYAGICHRG